MRMDAARWKFAAALVAFAAWVAGLGVLAATSGRRPAVRPSAAGPR